MTSRKPRTIKLGLLVYFWRVHHRHDSDPSPGIRRCAEVFTAFRERYPRSPVRILFPETDQHGSGYPSQRGVVVDYREPTRYINLNRPRLARLLIKLAITSGWVPESSRREFVLPDGYELLRAHGAQLDAALDADSDAAPAIS